MSSTEQKPTATQTLKPEEIPFTSPQLMSRYITDTGKILPRKYTGMSAKQQRRVTSKIKSARNLLTML
jgi:small subunit ribosomal protein S18